MKRHLNSFRFWWFAFAALALAVGQARGASSGENRAWEANLKQFEDAKSPLLWGMVETNFARFINKYPASDHFGDAVVFQARALFAQEKYDAMIALLSAQAGRADGAADQFAYWTARAYSRKQNYELAADTFARLVRDYTNSSLRLEAICSEAEAHAKLEYWPRVIEELGETNGVFQRMALTNQSDKLVVSGLLLLGEAELAQKEYREAEKTLSGMVTQNLRPDLEWERQFLLCRVQLASGQAQAALDASTNLLLAAAAARQPEFRAKSIFLQGEMHEQLEQIPAAIESFETNLNSDLAAVRRQAVLKIVELMLRQNQTGEAAQRLGDFLKDNPKEQGVDFELLLLGELRLKQHYETAAAAAPSAGGTNLLQVAETNFESIIKGFPNSDYLGKAELNLGWCLAADGRIADSQMAFGKAVELLPFSEDQAVARFKLADTLYQQKDFTGAVANYRAVIDRYDSLVNVKNELFEPALYQIVRAGLEQTNVGVATDAMNKIVQWFPQSLLADRSMLLVGQAQGPAEARELFSKFMTRFPQSPLLPEVKLAVARTYEQESNWTEAIHQYNDWVQTCPNNPALPRAEFSRAWADYRAAVQANVPETNAFLLFTNFVARFATNTMVLSNDLPARAQYWVGDYYWRQEDFQKAELSYKEIISRWPESMLALESQMMAGRAALNTQSAQAAITYFTNLINLGSNCPPKLMAQALFASGDASIALPSATTAAKYENAIYYFHLVVNTYTNSPIAAQAWGRLGDCYFALPGNEASQYENASNAFAKVIIMDSNLADATTRSMAEIRLGQTLEALARLAPASGQKSLLEIALEHFTNVLYGKNLRDAEQADKFWVKEAGLEAGKLAEDLREWDQARQFYERLLTIVPSLRATLEKKIARAQDNLGPAPAKN